MNALLLKITRDQASRKASLSQDGLAERTDFSPLFSQCSVPNPNFICVSFDSWSFTCTIAF